jgi:RNA-directed DNA polymerase
VRQAARQDKKVRFTALLHHITVDLLKQSYIALKRSMNIKHGLGVQPIS